MYWLLVEDESPKRQKIINLLNANFPDIEIREARSVRAGLYLVKQESPDLLLLDMSLPTFDVSPHETGGRPQTSGGSEILTYLEHFRINCPAIVVTGYEAFPTEDNSVIELSQLDEELKDLHDNYKGLVYYSSVYESWENELISLVNAVLRDKNT